MFLYSSGDLGGKHFGTGVTISALYNLLQAPNLIDALIMSQRGIEISDANILMILGGISFGGTDLFVLIFLAFALLEMV